MSVVGIPYFELIVVLLQQLPVILKPPGQEAHHEPALRKKFEKNLSDCFVKVN